MRSATDRGRRPLLYVALSSSPPMPAPAAPSSPTSRPFPSTWRLSLLIGLYELLWHLLLPVLLVFLWRRGRKEPLYRQFWGERFGATTTRLPRPLWVHSASMGEIRGAAPLVRALLAVGHTVLVTTLTPAGRTAAQKLHQISTLALKSFGELTEIMQSQEKSQPAFKGFRGAVGQGLPE